MKRLLSKLYYYIVKLRLFLYKTDALKSRNAQIPTFCVGNANVGGSGKTPFTQFLTSRLIELGYSPAILLRGYKGENKKAKIVDSNDTVKSVGDEAIMHYMQFNKSDNKEDTVPVIVSPDRFEGIELIKNKVDCIVMDDGMQHLALRANHYFLLLPRDLSKEEILPAGTLREPLYKAEKRANTIVKVKKNNNDFDYINSAKVILNFEIKSNKLIDLVSNDVVAKEKIKAGKIKRIDAICAIANPENFKKSIKELGIDINNFYGFKDHYKFSKKDINKLNFPVITTRKDAQKIAEFIKEPNKIFVLEQSYELDNLDKLDSIIEDTVKGYN